MPKNRRNSKNAVSLNLINNAEKHAETPRFYKNVQKVYRF